MGACCCSSGQLDQRLALVEQQEKIGKMENEMNQMKEEKDNLQKKLDEVQKINNAQLQRIFELETQIKTYQTNFVQMQQQKVMNWNGMRDEEKEQYQQQYAKYYQQQQQNHLLPIENTHLAPAVTSEYESMTALTDDASQNTEHSHSAQDNDTLRGVKALHGKNTMMNIVEYISDELKQEMEQKTDVVLLEKEENGNSN